MDGNNNVDALKTNSFTINDAIEMISHLYYPRLLLQIALNLGFKPQPAYASFSQVKLPIYEDHIYPAVTHSNNQNISIAIGMRKVTILSVFFQPQMIICFD